MLKDVLPFYSHLCEKCSSYKHAGPQSISDNVFFSFAQAAMQGIFNNTVDGGVC